MSPVFPSPSPRRARRTALAVAIAAHLLGLWGLSALRAGAVSPQRSVAESLLWVSLVDQPVGDRDRRQASPAPQQPARGLPPPPTAAPDVMAPVLAMPQPVSQATPAPAAVQTTVEPIAPGAGHATTSPPPARPQATPAPPRLLSADQVRYLVMPPAELPLLSRRAGEFGVVWLRVLIDAQGRPARIGVHRSSGYRRLDEQAVAAMAQARFVPAAEDGQAVAVEVIAPIEYPPD